MTGESGTSGDSRHDDSEWHHDGFPAWDTDERALRAARNEARESLEETISSIRRIDESAMKTLRTDLVILGLSVTVASSLQFGLDFVNELVALGVVAVSLSTLVAVVTALGSDYPTGVSEDYVEEFQRASWSEREWNAWMVREYSRWLSEANEMADGDARALLYARILLGAGLLSLVSGIIFANGGLWGLI